MFNIMPEPLLRNTKHEVIIDGIPAIITTSRRHDIAAYFY